MLYVLIWEEENDNSQIFYLKIILQWENNKEYYDNFFKPLIIFNKLMKNYYRKKYTKEITITTKYLIFHNNYSKIN